MKKKWKPKSNLFIFLQSSIINKQSLPGQILVAYTWHDEKKEFFILFSSLSSLIFTKCFFLWIFEPFCISYKRSFYSHFHICFFVVFDHELLDIRELWSKVINKFPSIRFLKLLTLSFLCIDNLSQNRLCIPFELVPDFLHQNEFIIFQFHQLERNVKGISSWNGWVYIGSLI